MRMLRPALAALVVLTPIPAFSQAAGGVPAYQAPAPVEVVRDGQKMERAAKHDADKDAGFGKQDNVIADFAAAYDRNGKPKLALFWNRQLSDTLNEWYSDSRVTNRVEGGSTMSGDITLNQSQNEQQTTAIERRVVDPRRASLSESFEWEFQDGFLNPFLEAGAVVLDRAAILRMTGADMNTSNERLVETRALQGKADYLMEILVSASGKSTTGYELRTRILDVKTGAVVAIVNSKNLKEWNPEKKLGFNEQGFVLPDEDDEDETFGPQGEEKVSIGRDGFKTKRKPPKLSKISQNLAYNTMTGLMRRWK